MILKNTFETFLNKALGHLISVDAILQMDDDPLQVDIEESGTALMLILPVITDFLLNSHGEFQSIDDVINGLSETYGTVIDQILGHLTSIF